MAGRVVIESVGVTEALVRNRMRMARLEDLGVELDAAANEFYAAEEVWYSSQGEGSWAPLAASTVDAKSRAGTPDPERALYAWGNLFQSVISSTGPYSVKQHIDPWSILIAADWDEGGWQIPVVLSEGTTTAGRGHHTHIPARPIWLDDASAEALQMIANIGELLLKGI